VSDDQDQDQDQDQDENENKLAAFFEQQPQIKQEQQLQQQQDRDNDDAPASKAEFDAGIAEIMSLLEDTEEMRRQERTLIQQLVAQIREHNDHLGSLVSNIKDSHAEIEQHRQAIAHKMQQIESVIAAPPATLATPSTPSTPTPICAKCTKRIEGDLGGFSVYRTTAAAAADSSQPQPQGTTTYECDECMPLSPTSRKFLENVNAEYEAMAAAAAEATEHPEPEENYYSDDDDLYMDDGYYPGFGGGYYDHAEECS
jgi:hypothetical protein